MGAWQTWVMCFESVSVLWVGLGSASPAGSIPVSPRAHRAPVSLSPVKQAPSACVTQTHTPQQGIQTQEVEWGQLVFYLCPGWSEAELLVSPGNPEAGPWWVEVKSKQ